MVVESSKNLPAFYYCFYSAVLVEAAILAMFFLKKLVLPTLFLIISLICHHLYCTYMTVFKDSIHIGSMSPSNMIHLGPSEVRLA